MRTQDMACFVCFFVLHLFWHRVVVATAYGEGILKIAKTHGF